MQHSSRICTRNSVPTYEAEDRFWREFRRLSLEDQRRFRDARRELVSDLATRAFRPSLRVQRYQGDPGVWEMTWAPDGRALFRYGEERTPGSPHIVWLRIGSHDIFRTP